MSPEYKSITQLPRSIVKETRNAMSQVDLDFAYAVQVGFVICKPNGRVTKVALIEEVSENVLKDARKQNSSWHLVNGLENPYGLGQKSNMRIEGDYLGGSYVKEYRGNHRMDNRGPGFKAFARSSKFTNNHR